jgi:hypothetical protein
MNTALSNAFIDPADNVLDHAGVMLRVADLLRMVATIDVTELDQRSANGLTLMLDNAEQALRHAAEYIDAGGDA